MALFADRTEAGRLLAAELRSSAADDALVIGIARGGVVTAAAVAEELGLDLGAVVVRKLGATGNPEVAVGAIAEGVRLVSDDAVRWAGMTDADLAQVEATERDELARRRGVVGAPLAVAGRRLIVVDDGVATGASATAACRALRAQGPARSVLAVPVAPAHWHPPADAVDDYVCPHRVTDFWAVGGYYADFRQTTDAEVAALLAR